MKSIVVGIFVGGQGRRMGFVEKGLLPIGDTTVAARAVALAKEIADEVVLVGGAAAYASLGVTAIADARAASGPLGGLVALLAHARERPAIALACDMPYVSPPLLRRLATEHRDAVALAPRQGSRWNALFARYDSPRAFPFASAQLDAGTLSLQPLLDHLSARELTLDADEESALGDWDRPEDIEP